MFHFGASIVGAPNINASAGPVFRYWAESALIRSRMTLTDARAGSIWSTRSKLSTASAKALRLSAGRPWARWIRLSRARAWPRRLRYRGFSGAPLRASSSTRRAR